MFNDKTREQCIICGGEVPVGASQSITTQAPWGEFTVYYHSPCAINDPRGMDAVVDALKKKAEENNPDRKR